MNLDHKFTSQSIINYWNSRFLEVNHHNYVLYFQELMVEFFNAKMQECGLCTASGRPVITAQIDMEKNYAFLEVC